MFRYTLLIWSLFTCMLSACAAPTLNSTDTELELDKRITHWGRGTWFYVGLGNCGQTNKDSDAIVAISKARYDDNNGGNCDQWIEIIDTKNGKKAYGKTRDSCPGCGYDDLDLSPSLFAKFDSLDVGVLSLEWHFMAKGWSP